jgi:glucarate dehydratase
VKITGVRYHKINVPFEAPMPVAHTPDPPLATNMCTALQVQLGAALPVLPHAIDSHYHHQTEDVITEPRTYVDGCFRLPAGPGLGVEIDEEKLKKLERLNESGGDLVFYGHEDQRDSRYMGSW